MHSFLIFIHILVAFVLMIVILMQSGYRGGGLSSTFGGMGGGDIFGGRGAAPFLSKLTAVLAAIFVVTCITLSLKPKVSAKAESKALKQMERQAEESSQAKALSPSSLFNEGQPESDSLGE